MMLGKKRKHSNDTHTRLHNIFSNRTKSAQEMWRNNQWKCFYRTTLKKANVLYFRSHAIVYEIFTFIHRTHKPFITFPLRLVVFFFFFVVFVSGVSNFLSNNLALQVCGRAHETHSSHCLYVLFGVWFDVCFHSLILNIVFKYRFWLLHNYRKRNRIKYTSNAFVTYRFCMATHQNDVFSVNSIKHWSLSCLE